MRPPVSATLAVWATAWLAGTVGYDDVLDAVTVGAERHVVLDLPASQSARRISGEHGSSDYRSNDYGSNDYGSNDYGASDYGSRDGAAWLGGREPASNEHLADRGSSAGRAAGETSPARLGAVLIAWRAAGEPVRACLPVPGDVRGVPTSRAFLAAALEAGQGAYAGGIGVVPARPANSPSSAAPTTIWRAFSIDAAVADVLQLSEAEHDLAVAVRETATLLRDSDLSGGRTPGASELDRVRRASESLRLPAGFPPRAAALLASAERLHAMVELAGRDGHGGAVNGAGIDTRAAALRELAVTVRRARLAAYNTPWR